MKKTFLALVLISLPSLAWAYPPSILGGKKLQGTSVHNVGLGWPSIMYEWWNSGNPDWALGAELVYGDWSGEYSDVDIGAAFNVPLKWVLSDNGKVAVGFKFQPGALLGSADAPGDDKFVFGLRGEVGVPVSIGLAHNVNLITGGVVPFSIFMVEDGDNPVVVVPILPRIGVEVLPQGKISIWFLAELGPTMVFADGDNDADFGIRGWVGATFW
jgi:hypothetical protein